MAFACGFPYVVLHKEALEIVDGFRVPAVVVPDGQQQLFFNAFVCCHMLRSEVTVVAQDTL